MTKPTLINHPSLVKLLAKQADYPQYIVKDILHALAVVLPQELLRGSKVKIEGVGTISPKKSTERDFVSLLTGVRTTQWTKVSCTLKPDKLMSNALNFVEASDTSNALNNEELKVLINSKEIPVVPENTVESNPD